MPEKKKEIKKPEKSKKTHKPRLTEKPKFNAAIILILIYIGLSIIGNIQNLFTRLGIIGPIIFTGIPALIFYLFLTLVFVALFIGIIKRKEWGRDLGIFLYIILLVWGIVNTLFLLINPSLVERVIAITVGNQPGAEIAAALFVPMSIISVIIGSIINILIIWYLHKRKDFFTN